MYLHQHDGVNQIDDRTADSPVLLFDGVCNLCTGAVQWVIAHDRDARVMFASLQSPRGEHLRRAYGVGADSDSQVLIVGGHAYTHSSAVLRTAGLLRWPWRAALLLLAVPRPVRDGAYRFVARRRYGWFGRTQACWLPTPALLARFVTDGT